jgi:SAM-dependent methyltransferase
VPTTVNLLWWAQPTLSFPDRLSGIRVQMRSFNARDRQPEIMDRPELSAADHHQALEGLERVNRISGTVRTLWNNIRPLVSDSREPLRVLDLACGGGDVALGLWRLGQRCGAAMSVAGCDVNAVAVGHAAAKADALRADVHFFQHDVLHAPLPDGFDVLTSTLFLHHLNDDQAVALMTSMRQTARRRVLVSDLIRGRLGYVLAWWGCRLVTRSYVVRTDGPLSVRAAYTIDEARALADRAGLSGATLTRHWPQRFLLKWDHP